MIVKVITLFPDFFDSPLKSGLLGKAVKTGIVTVEIVDLRLYSEDKYNRCDDYPFGGGAGMVLMPGPLSRALEDRCGEDTRVLLTSPAGETLTQKMVRTLSEIPELCIICGHYEGIDQRIIDRYVDDEVSIGDYVLSGGEYAALAIIDAVSRYVPGFMSNEESLQEESFEDDLLEYPHYTRPSEFSGLCVPEILLSGDHKKIAQWRQDKRIERTRKVRPDLYKRYLMRKLLGE
ncbi:MAG TPA: tRNA (guanosine(37)-N1)-methyltransferase TrmD [Spirochaetota bacterium]|nr:tRNA (guanosine(37)-N1)-methyltransferase TrmD [Spirochaetota bacterium]HPI87845.1 tRNA (guanosine(37)-N1)-methyltransferase TrmD [Spirochaetota bacterium]HPR47423.1 tRNA (guanosine(37)-N1)-methyltransferase TrmD [Spirochaetota bacterium]